MITEIKNNYPSNLLRIEYMLGNLCNHKCSYCFPGSNEGTHPWPNINQVKQNLGHLLDHYKHHGKNKFQFYLVGGEPTLWKELPELCYFLKSQYDTIINISTNATRKLDWWQDNGGLFDNVEISVHHEFANINHIISVADLLYSKNINLVCNVLMDPNHFEKCQGIITELKSSKRRWGVVAKSVKYNGQTRYTEEQKQFLKFNLKRIPNILWYVKTLKNPVLKTKSKVKYKDGTTKTVYNDNWYTLNNFNQFSGWSCNLGVDHIEIYQDGTISGNCRQKIYNYNGYYNLYSPNFTEVFNPEIVPTTCRQLICGCTSEIVINKHAKF